MSYLGQIATGLRAPAAGAVDGRLDPSLHDADGKQLVQQRIAAQIDPSWDEFPTTPQLDLDLASTARRRALRARTIRRR